MSAKYSLEVTEMVVESSTKRKTLRWISLYWKYVVLFITPILCCPVLVVVENDDVSDNVVI